MLQMNRALFISSLFVLCSSLAQAEKVYRSVDDKGVVEFSDQDRRDAEEMDVRKVPTYEFKKRAQPLTTSPGVVVQNNSEIQLQIESPASGETIRSNQGELTIKARLMGRDGKSLRELKQGEKMMVLLDGKRLLEERKTTVLLKNIDRGSHQLKIVITDLEGKPLAESQSVEFFMKRFSKLFKKPVTPPPSPPSLP